MNNDILERAKALGRSIAETWIRGTVWRLVHSLPLWLVIAIAIGMAMLVVLFL